MRIVLAAQKEAPGARAGRRRRKHDAHAIHSYRARRANESMTSCDPFPARTDTRYAGERMAYARETARARNGTIARRDPFLLRPTHKRKRLAHRRTDLAIREHVPVQA